MKMILEFSIVETIAVEEDSFLDEYIFFISTSYSWYRDILVYLQTLKCHVSFTREDRHKLRVNAEK